MIFSLTIETSEEELTKCICIAHNLRYGDGSITPENIKPFGFHDEIATSYIENMLIGSSLGELARQSVNVKMKRVD